MLVLILAAIVVVLALELIWLHNLNKPNYIEIDDEKLAYKREFIRNMTRDAWYAYMQYAWGKNALKPVSKAFYNDWFADKIVDSQFLSAMTTLEVMGMEQEFDQGRQWIEQELDSTKFDGPYDSPESKIASFIGSLLSCAALRNDSMFLEKANQIAELLKPAFNTTTGWFVVSCVNTNFFAKIILLAKYIKFFHQSSFYTHTSGAATVYGQMYGPMPTTDA